MPVLAAASAIFAFLALLFLIRTFGNLRRRRPMRAGGAGLGCITSATLAGFGSMLMLSYLSYERLTDEQIVSEISFRRINLEEFQARLMQEGAVDQLFVLRGDEWQIDARIVTWKPPMTILGLDPIYRFDRLSGRYADIDRERSAARTVHSLAGESPLDVWRVARQYPAFIPGIDAQYGTATYVPMVDGARYEISLSRDALIARPVNDAAREAVGRWDRE